MLEHRDDGVYAYGFFNGTDKASHAKIMLEHEDINMMSIWANQLIEQSKRVMHGVIREVSLVLSGANPGALIENVTIRHSDGVEQPLDDEAIIYTGLEIEHSDESDDEVEHADDEGSDDGESIEDIFNTLSPKQKDVVYYLIGEAASGGSAAQDDLGDADDDDTLDHGQMKEGNEMPKRNVFDQNGQTAAPENVISHDEMAGIMQSAIDAKGSLRDSVKEYALSHGIEDIESLFPEATALTAAPEFFGRRMEWVNDVLGAATKRPFSRIKTHNADLTHDDARAKGYIKGNMKKEEFFTLSRRTTTPQTVYKKQKLDRDDIIDITDFDVVTWMKGEMRVMLDEELARAILLGDGREIDDEDHISHEHIRPIAYDDELYTTVLNVDMVDASSSIQEFTDAFVANRYKMRGSGNPTMFTTEFYIAKAMLLKDSLGRRIYNSLGDWAAELRVSKIVPVEVMEDYPDLVAIFVNMSDYSCGADRGGQVALFDDFDIDYNQYKYLIETRMSGALTKLKCALVVKSTQTDKTLVVPLEPAFDGHDVTITNVTGVTYKVSAFTGTPTYNAVAVTVGQTVTATYPIVMNAEGEEVEISATPTSASYFFATSDDDTWAYEYEA
jgi:hypothetical protein